MAHDQRALDAALVEAGAKVPADGPLVEPIYRRL